MNTKISIAEFLAHLIVVDKQIHSSEMTILEEFMVNYEFEPFHREGIYKILGDADDQKPFEETLKQLKDITIDEHYILKHKTMKIFCVNAHIDTAASKLIKKATEYLKWDVTEMQNLQRVYYDEVMSSIEKNRAQFRSVDNWKRFKTQFKATFATGKKRTQLKKEVRRMTLTGPEYTNAILKSATIAEADARFLENIVINDKSKIATIISSIEKIIAKNESSTNEKKEVLDSLNEFYKFIKTDAQASLQENEAVLNAKKRAMNFFTISFLGRTKAGKSTLHYVLTDEGKNFIGKGLERTTRYNRVYEWDNLRIIDTPGIAAAEIGGRSDEEIALSIVDESDIICYVVTDDSIQATEFAFLKQIRDKNKPVIILLNNKKNIQPLPFYKKFINDPHEWFNSKDSENINRSKIDGHIHRITQYVNEYYDSKCLKIIPVHLLAAKMSKLKEFEKDSDILFEGSHLNEFLDYLREGILASSSIRRSQTIIDGASSNFSKILLAATEHLKKLEALNNKVEDKQRGLNDKIEKSETDIKNKINRNIKVLFDELREFAAGFSETNYDAGDSLSNRWSNVCKNEFDIDQKLKNATKQPFIALLEDINDDMSDLINDLGNFISSNFDDIGSGGDTFNSKRLMSGLSAGLGAVGTVLTLFLGASNPIGWVVIGVGAFVGLLSSLFKSKAKKIAEAKEKVRNSLYNSLDKQKSDILEKIDDYTKKGTESIQNNVNTTLEVIKKTLSESINIASEFVNTLNGKCRTLDIYFAQRVVDYLTDNECSDISSSYGKEISVDRVYGKYFTIKSNKTIAQKDLDNLKDLLQNSNITITK